MPLKCAAIGLSAVLGILALAVSNDVQEEWVHGSLCGWQRTFGGDGWDVGFSVQQTSDGGFILLGWTESFGAGDYDFWLIKTDAEGQMVWQRTFGGNDVDIGVSVQQTSDGGFILLGWTESFGEGYDLWLIKTDAEGQMVWQRTFGGNDWNRGYSVQQTSDGGFILLGETGSFGTGKTDFWLIKTDAEGQMVWQRTFGGNDWDVGFSVQQTSDGGFILLGWTESFGARETDLWLIKTDAEGQMVWQRTFGGNDWDVGYSVQQTSDGGFILLGGTASFGTGELADFWLIKTDAEGQMVWQRTFGGNDWDVGYSVQQTSDGGFILLGETESFGEGYDFWLIKTDAEGQMVWQRTFGGNDWNRGYSVQQTSDGGFILLGWTESFGARETDLWLIKTDAKGRRCGPWCQNSTNPPLDRGSRSCLRNVL